MVSVGSSTNCCQVRIEQIDSVSVFAHVLLEIVVDNACELCAKE